MLFNMQYDLLNALLVLFQHLNEGFAVLFESTFSLEMSLYCTVLLYAISQLHCCKRVRLDTDQPYKNKLFNCLHYRHESINECMCLFYSCRVTDLHAEERKALVCLRGAGDD